MVHNQCSGFRAHSQGVEQHETWASKFKDQGSKPASSPTRRDTPYGIIDGMLYSRRVHWLHDPSHVCS